MAKLATDRAKTVIVRKNPAQNTNLSTDETAEIQKLAYQFYVERGFQHGFDKEDWSRAEAIVKKRRKF